MESRKAGEQVANTYELLEAVLIHLHPPELICAQAVSKSFSTIIKRSLRLQQKFLMECPLKAYERCFFPLRCHIPRMFRNISIQRLSYYKPLELVRPLYLRAELNVEYLRDAKAQCGGSYEKLLLYGPLTTTITISSCRKRGPMTSNGSYDIVYQSSTGGITLGDLVALAKQMEELEPFEHRKEIGSLIFQTTTYEDGSTKTGAGHIRGSYDEFEESPWARTFEDFVEEAREVLDDPLEALTDRLRVYGKNCFTSCAMRPLMNELRHLKNEMPEFRKLGSASKVEALEATLDHVLREYRRLEMS